MKGQAMNNVSKILVGVLFCAGARLNSMEQRQALTDIFMSAYNSGQVVVKAYQPPLNGWPKIGFFLDTTGEKWGVYAIPGQPINYPLLTNLHNEIQSIPGIWLQHGGGSAAIGAILVSQPQVSYDFVELIANKKKK